jgi:predicted MFS family arabinose efflux permease
MSPIPENDASSIPTRALAVLSLASFAAAANLRVCDPLLPQVAREFDVTVGTAAAIVTAFAVAYGVCQIVVGPLSEARGKLRMVVLGSFWAGIATALSAAVPNLDLLVVIRFLGGAGAAAIIPLALAWMGDVIPYDRRQPVMARFLSGQILGIVFGQAIGGLLGELIGWRGTMIVLGLSHCAAGALLMREMGRLTAHVPEPRPPRWRDAAFDTLGILKRPWVRIVLASVFVEALLMFGAFAYVGAELHQRFGLGLGWVGGTLASFGAGALCYVLAAPKLVRMLGQTGLTAAGACFIAAGYAILAFMPWLALAPPAIAVIGLGFYMLHGTLQVNATQMAPEARGLSLSLFAFFLFIGQSVGVALAAPVMDRFGATPIFMTAALGVLMVAIWFRHQLLRRETEAEVSGR